jgi:phosphoglycolate phosphatase-like HAD superfamily hydrolase
VALHVEHGGRSRYEKFDMIYRDILRRTPGVGEFQELGRRFEVLVGDQVVACPFVQGAKAFLEEYSRRLPLIVVSGTPDGELRSIIDRRHLTPFFEEIHGSPPGKEEILTALLDRRGWAAGDVLFVGDSMSDWLAATAVRTRFVARVPVGEQSVFPDSVAMIPDLSALPGLLPQMWSAAECGDGERR